jgi:Flp pilus assembly CpaE family ATPase
VTTEKQSVEDVITAPQRPRLDDTRTLVAIGDAARERVVLQLLAETAEDGPPLRLTRRCLDAEDLVHAVHSGEIDAAIVSADLHGFGVDTLHALAHVRIPLVLWGVNSGTAPDPLDATRVTVLPSDVDLARLRIALRGLATTGGRLRRPGTVPAVLAAKLERAVLPAYLAPAPHSPGAARGGTVIALVGAPGGQGVSIVAAGLTAALSRKGSAALIDLNLERPSQALALDLNPARNLYMVLHEAGTRDDPNLWARLLESEFQPLDPAVPSAVVLAGAPGGGHAAKHGADAVRQLLRQLAGFEQFVVADVGSTIDGSTPVAGAHRAVLEVADRVFIVTRSDIVSLRRAAHLLESLRAMLEDHDRRLVLVLNQHQSQHHHDPVEVARALRTPVAAVIPNDPKGVHAALAAQRPLVAFGRNGRGSAGRAVVDLARQLHGAADVQPSQVASRTRRIGLNWPRAFLPLRGKGDVHERCP